MLTPCITWREPRGLISYIGESLTFENKIRAVVKGELSRNIPNTIGILQEETRYGFDKELGECHDWSNFTLYSKLVRLVALLSGRVFVGCPISRNEDWIESSVQYTIDCNKTCKAVLKYPSYLRKILVRFLPEIKRLKLHRQRGSKILEPIFERCLEKHLSEKSGFETFDTEQGHFMSWILNYLEDPSSITQLIMASYQMICKFMSRLYLNDILTFIQVAFASIHTTTTVACHALYDLMARPEYIQPLRDEIQQVMAEDGHDVAEEGNTQMKRGSLSKLKKLDSFIKESQRVNPLGLGMQNPHSNTTPSRTHISSKLSPRLHVSTYALLGCHTSQRHTIRLQPPRRQQLPKHTRILPCL